MERIDSRWFARLMAYWEIAPFGDEMEMLAKVCQMICVGHGVKFDGEDPVWQDFMPSRRPVILEDIPIQSAAEARANLRDSLPESK